MRNISFILGLLAVTAIGCIPAPESGRGFTLPEGDAVIGRATFQRLNCHACHAVDGIEQILPLGVDHGNVPEMSVELGGEVGRIQTYGELVTSIINPSHRLASGQTPAAAEGAASQSKMVIYNDRMTVTELADLVAFLQAQYKLRPTPPTPYPPYY